MEQTKKQTKLNTAQRKAVAHINGSLLVIAGAGSGKTRVITSRIINLLQEEQVHPAQIVALTFTNKAANEMKERITSSLEGKIGVPFIGTFHSYCLYLLKTNTHFLPFDTFSILDEEDKRTLLGKLIKKTALYKKHTPQQLSYQISLIKNQCAHPDEPLAQRVENRLFQELIIEYEKEKNKSKCFDFDDLLLEAVKLFDNKQFKEDHQYQVKHLLIDEYQDTNVIQHALLKQMALEKKNSLAVDSICVVGDEDQSIYSWRGATVDNIIHFKKDFKGTKQIKIEQNYRSKQPILTVANKVIAHNKNRNEKKLFSEKKGRDCVRQLHCLSGYQEADIIARFCKLLYRHKRLTSTAVLYRTHFQSRTIEEALIKHGVPYHLIGGVRFYERKEIKDILAYLRLVLNPFDRLAFNRVINCPARGLGDKFVEQFMHEWDLEPLSNFKDVAKKLINNKTFPRLKEESLKTFTNIFYNLTPQAPAAQTIATILTNAGYLAHVKKSYEKEEAQDRQANIKEFLNAAHFFASQGKTTVEALLDEVMLLQEKAALDEKKETGVTLMTLHAAKGLEFDNVIISGLEENLFPSPRSINDSQKLEEERRLFYVGITRARNRLLLTNARYRQTYGQMEEVTTSRFLHEVPKTQCKMENASAWQQYEVTTYFSLWCGFSTANPEVMTFREFIPSKQIKTSTSSKLTTSTLKKHQTIKHKTFGIGIVKTVEERKTKTVITAQFKVGIKKLDAKFVQPV